MSGFFPPVPAPPPEPPDSRLPPWAAPPENERGVIVPLQIDLARTDGVSLVVVALVAYSSGFVVMLALRQRIRRDPRDRRPGPFSSHGQREDDLRFGLQFSDGTKATTARGPRPGEDREPAEPLLMLRGSRGTGRTTETELWVSPLPPPGPLVYVCEWRAAGIPLTRHEGTAEPILEAAARVEELWPDECPPATGPWAHAFG
jgi:hypothetical protein